MSLDSMVTNIGAVLLVVGIFAAFWGRMHSRENGEIRDMGVLLATAGFACMASTVLLF